MADILGVSRMEASAMTPKRAVVEFLQRRAARWSATADLRMDVPGIPDRTLRRWLADLVEEGLVERSGARKGARYRWIEGRAPQEQMPQDSPAAATIFSPAATHLLQMVERPLYTRSPVTYAEDWVRSYVPNQTFYLSDTQRAQLQKRGKRPGIPGRAGTYIQKIFDRLLIDLSYNSSRLEGNTYSLADTEQLVIKGIGAAGKLNEEQVMILNHKEAIRYLAKDPAQLMLEEETIRTVHYLLADGLVPSELAGQIRNEGVMVSGTTYSPLEGRDRLSAHLQELLRQARLIEDPFEQSFFLLGHISYLQAFVDVNKRLARLASIIPLIKNDSVPQSFVDADKNDYMKALICFYEFNEVLPLAELYCWSYFRTCEHYDTTVQVLGFDEISVLYRSQRRALVGDIVRSMIALQDEPAFLETHIPSDVNAEHREKFLHDVMADLDQLDAARLPGLGIDKAQLQEWLRLRRRA
jgi:Fic family protein